MSGLDSIGETTASREGSASHAGGFIPVVLGLVGLAAAPAMAASDCASTPAMMAGMAHVAEQDYTDMDDNAFTDSHKRMLTDVSCLASPPSPAEVAQVHRVEALAAFTRGDTAATVASLRAMLESDPATTLSSDIAPPGHALQGLLAQAEAAAPSKRALSRVHDPCRLIVDGRAAHDLPKERPSLVVIQDPSGAVMWSGLLPADAMVLTICPALTDGGIPYRPEDPPPRKGNRGLNLAAGSTSLVAGMLWGAALYDRMLVSQTQSMIARGYDPDQLSMSQDEVIALRNQTDGLGLAAQAASGVALTFGAFALGARFVW